MQIGDVLKYKLSQSDVQRIVAQRSLVMGRTTAVGNPHMVGQVVPLIVVVIWPNEGGPLSDGVNGQLVLDGPDSLWVTSVLEGDEPGQWRA